MRSLLTLLVLLGCSSPALAEPRPGDLVFQESRSAELVWKMFAHALDLELVPPQRWSELPLGPRAESLARRRLGRLPPANGLVVTPASLVDSPYLIDPASATRPASMR